MSTSTALALDPADRDTWLIDAAVQSRLQEVDLRMLRARVMAFAAVGVALIVGIGQFGVVPLLPVPLAGVGYFLADFLLQRGMRAEWVYAGTWALSQAMIALSAVMTGGPDSPMLMWLAIPVATGVGRFTPRGLAAAVGLTVVLMAAAAVGADPQRVHDAPYLLAYPLSLVCGIALIGSALRRSEVEHRADAILDPLTQMLNRKALAARGRELALQSEVSGRPVGVLLGDIDRFKVINDREGHQTGDAVLREIAYRWRAALRAYDLAYRLGGEEFVVLVPGADAEEAVALAERLRAVISAEPIAGQRVTLSFGVAVSGAGGFDLETQYARADAALYRAKDAGRDRVAVAD